MTDDARIRVGISSCLLGEEVRFDGGHKHDRFVTGTLARFFDLVAVCPEMEMGLGAPREAMRLVGDAADPRLVTRTTQIDHTDAMKRWAAKRLEQIASLDLSGYILKSDSPSCGMERVRVYGASGMAVRTGIGLFARALLERLPLLPVEEEGRLHDLPIRENFVERVFSYWRWQRVVAGGLTRRKLVEFHTAHKYLLLAHSPTHYREMGRLVAAMKGRTSSALAADYGAAFMRALAVRATPAKHTNVLHHVMGFLKRDLSADDKRELLSVIDDFRRGLVPLVVPITLLKHHLARHPSPWVQGQVYLEPHPKELMLRNHV
jgi:uncharacterized protein YbgA (DUF1722 family)/uncharacterized protein YbbK (DUF523 family)